MTLRNNEEDEDRVIVSAIIGLPDDFYVELLTDEGFDLSIEEMEALTGETQLHVFFEIDSTTGEVYPLGVR